MTSTYLVTGANRGIGLEYCRQLVKRGEEVIATCRNSSRELDALDVHVEEGVEITSNSSILKLKKKLGTKYIDVLIQNAGILEEDIFDKLDIESLRRQVEVNAFAPIFVSNKI